MACIIAASCMAAPATAFPVRQAMPDGTAVTIEVDPALLPAFGLPPAAVAAVTSPDLPAAASTRFVSAATSSSSGAQASRALGGLSLKAARGAGEGGRWYLYAGTGRKIYGLQMFDERPLAVDSLAREREGGTRAGIAWRKGDLQTAVGYLRGKAPSNRPGVAGRSDDRVGLTLNWRPH